MNDVGTYHKYHVWTWTCVKEIVDKTISQKLEIIFLDTRGKQRRRKDNHLNNLSENWEEKKNEETYSAIPRKKKKTKINPGGKLFKNAKSHRWILLSD